MSKAKELAGWHSLLLWKGRKLLEADGQLTALTKDALAIKSFEWFIIQAEHVSYLGRGRSSRKVRKELSRTMDDCKYWCILVAVV